MREHQLGHGFGGIQKDILTGRPLPGGLRDLVEGYLTNLMGSLPGTPRGVLSRSDDPNSLAHDVFRALTARQFCYLSRSRSAPYADEALALIGSGIESGKPLRFYYDIGAGYHASICPSDTGLTFHVGASELFMISQAMSFSRRIAQLYPPGIEFTFVIDNICALMTNDIPLIDTLAYVESLRSLLHETQVEDTIKLLVESEVCSLADYDLNHEALTTDVPRHEPTAVDIENVERFLGRRCEREEALARIQRYKLAGAITDRLLNRIIDGVHMTQRATPATLPFRPFPGGDSRTQCGEVVLTIGSKGQIRPTLLTTRNAANFLCVPMTFPNLLPPSVPQITFAQPTGH